MIGAIAGDIIGSVYEWNRIKTKKFNLFSPDCHFTDDSVLTIALADAILSDKDYGTTMKSYYRRYPHAGYGGFWHWWHLVALVGPRQLVGLIDKTPKTRAVFMLRRAFSGVKLPF